MASISALSFGLRYSLFSMISFNSGQKSAMKIGSCLSINSENLSLNLGIDLFGGGHAKLIVRLFWF